MRGQRRRRRRGNIVESCSVHFIATLVIVLQKVIFCNWGLLFCFLVFSLFEMLTIMILSPCPNCSQRLSLHLNLLTRASTFESTDALWSTLSNNNYNDNDMLSWYESNNTDKHPSALLASIRLTVCGHVPGFTILWFCTFLSFKFIHRGQKIQKSKKF